MTPTPILNLPHQFELTRPPMTTAIILYPDRCPVPTVYQFPIFGVVFSPKQNIHPNARQEGPRYLEGTSFLIQFSCNPPTHTIRH
ncbi:hypothetical protein P875_00095371 [Aspergillus parasiticus SU-1]|uniref:Uncharacterized protein n=1 Tax=Aspergillus parasiticus (strain ATCC 56775 / NRRL 5862 / SRRC 143 / SU-1) TaxID=1403190 RepID=A0A0F0I426_ASPPU|nr:hypothetical protein P875_00095371 [Aspergillus parasiticus SU-1]